MTVASPRPVTPVGILAERLRALHRRVDEWADPDPELREELEALGALAAGLEPYLDDCTSPESAALADLARRTRERDWEGRGEPDAVVALESEMLSGHVEGRLLGFLVEMTHARRVLEIGMFSGYSALAMAEALGPDGRLIACELDPDAAAFAQRAFDAAPAGARIEVRVGPALETLKSLSEEGQSFDLVFLDADKAGYPGYLDTLLARDLLAPGGTICVDNTLMQGEPWLAADPSPNGEAIARFNAALAADPRVRQVLLPIRDGMTLVRRA